MVEFQDIFLDLEEEGLILSHQESHFNDVFVDLVLYFSRVTSLIWG